MEVVEKPMTDNQKLQEQSARLARRAGLHFEKNYFHQMCVWEAKPPAGKFVANLEVFAKNGSYSPAEAWAVLGWLAKAGYQAVFPEIEGHLFSVRIMLFFETVDTTQVFGDTLELALATAVLQLELGENDDE